eukprot:tig00021045_g17655.t1
MAFNRTVLVRGARAVVGFFGESYDDFNAQSRDLYGKCTRTLTFLDDSRCIQQMSASELAAIPDGEVAALRQMYRQLLPGVATTSGHIVATKRAALLAAVNRATLLTGTRLAVAGTAGGGPVDAPLLERTVLDCAAERGGLPQAVRRLQVEWRALSARVLPSDDDYDYDNDGRLYEAMIEVLPLARDLLRIQEIHAHAAFALPRM